MNKIIKIYKDSDIKIFIKLFNSKLLSQLNVWLNSFELSIFNHNLSFSDMKWKKIYLFYQNSILKWLCAIRIKKHNFIYISDFYILPEYQWKWLWWIMMDLLLMNNKNYKFIILETYKKNINAIKFYRKIWFTYIEPRKLNETPVSKIYKKLVEDSFLFFKVNNFCS